jgi:hypothetical protein
VIGGSARLVGRLDQRLDHHLAVTPVLELVLEDERQRADRRGVGDLARVVLVERVRRDEARDVHPVDADELLDRQLGRLGLGERVHEPDHRVVRRLRQPVRVHLAELGQALVPQLGVPRVLVAVRPSRIFTSSSGTVAIQPPSASNSFVSAHL